MGKKNKGKKRARTERLYEAARKAQKSENVDEIGEADENTQETKEEIDRNLEDADSLQESGITSASISDSDLLQTIRTLKILTATPQSIEMVRHSKRFKEFRGLLHPLVVQQLKTYERGIDYRHRTTAHLAQQEYGAALTSLQACADLDQHPKQGTIQRWVREVDSCPHANLKISLLSRILTLGDDSHDKAAKNNKGIHPAQDLEDDYEGLNKHDPKLALLQAQQERQRQSLNGNSVDDDTDGITILDSWKIPNANNDTSYSSGGVSRAAEETTNEAPMKLKSLILYSEKAEERTPPNNFDLHLHYVIPKHDSDCILPDSKDGAAKIPASFCMVPFLSGARVLQNVFTDDECAKLIQIATTLGYRPDHPKSLAEPTGIDSCEWLIPDTLQNLVFERVKNLLPATNLDLQATTEAHDDSKAKAEENDSRGGNPCFELNSINKRWRFFRYGQGCVYRPHIDGSWPESKLVPRSKEDEADESTDQSASDSDVVGRSFRQQYKYDTDASGETRSFLTFLIYLNDGFEGGATRFYRSSNGGSGEASGTDGMVAQGVQPKKGCVLVFPQGNTASLLHEGSAVTKGTKYVVRTDVLYRRKSTKE